MRHEQKYKRLQMIRVDDYCKLTILWVQLLCINFSSRRGGGVQSQFSVALLFEFNNFEFQTPIIMKMSLIDLNILIKRDKYCAI